MTPPSGDRPRPTFARHPAGWFAVAFSEELTAEPRPLHGFGRALVGARAASGRAQVRAVSALPTREQDGLIHVFHGPGAPWPLPRVDLAGWTPGRTVTWRGLRARPSAVVERVVAVRGARRLGPPRCDGVCMTVQLEAPGAALGLPGRIGDVHLRVELRGLGWARVRMDAPASGLAAQQRIHVTPVDERTVDVRAVVHVRRTDASDAAALARDFHAAFVRGFTRDLPIWDQAGGSGGVRPALVPLWRRWCAQFHPGTAASLRV
ncbi:MAG TPA: hypothetical protein RMH99_08425 [Sandaracinaceae bacterium LLY-WYZ-13_1]|nr:hypothetical protein [Sandaracinaceae bacterium LLY-WYZ-13_1]